MARDNGGPALLYQALLYPSTDLSATLDPARTGVEYTMNTLERAYFHTECYINTWEEAKNPQISPLLAENLAGLPPTLMVTAEYDLLLEQDQQYAERLQEAGVLVTSRHYSGMMHGFINMADFLDQGKLALTEVGMTLRRVFYPSEEHLVTQDPQERNRLVEKREHLQAASPVEE